MLTSANTGEEVPLSVTTEDQGTEILVIDGNLELAPVHAESSRRLYRRGFTNCGFERGTTCSRSAWFFATRRSQSSGISQPVR